MAAGWGVVSAEAGWGAAGWGLAGWGLVSAAGWGAGRNCKQPELAAWQYAELWEQNVTTLGRSIRGRDGETCAGIPKYMIRPDLGQEELKIHSIIDMDRQRDFRSEFYLFHARCIGTNHPIIEGLLGGFKRS
jgi:hypothetical protein